MKFSLRKALLPLMVCGSLMLAGGCTQHDDVVQPLTSSTITLDPDYLPELDSIYVYELWMVKVQNPDDDYTAPDAEFISLRKFLWDNSVDRFRDLDGNAISDAIDLPESWLAYDYIVMTVENRVDPAPDAPSGVFMLVDEVVDQNIRPIVMKYPASMFLATGFFFVGTPTNDTTYYSFDSHSLVRVTPNEEKGLWICSRFLTERSLQDTLGVLSLDTNMVVDTFDTVGKYDPDTINVIWPPDSTWDIIIDTVIFGYDTLQHRRINLEWEVIYDTMYDYNLFPEYDIDSITTVEYPYPLGRIPYYEYAGPLGDVPDISPYGWRYNSWVILEQPETSDNSGMGLATVIPFGNGRLEAFTGENSWGVLPLGGFIDPTAPDLNNPHIDNREVPQFPGEDFVEDASPRYDNLNLFRIADHSWGYAVIGIEPDPNLITINAETNFPLFILSAEIPSGDAYDAYQIHVFHNWSQFLPEINISVEMRD